MRPFRLTENLSRFFPTETVSWPPGSSQVGSGTFVNLTKERFPALLDVVEWSRRSSPSENSDIVLLINLVRS